MLPKVGTVEVHKIYQDAAPEYMRIKLCLEQFDYYLFIIHCKQGQV